MGDSELSAAQLRKRYHRGGTISDHELTASQLRARHGIPANSGRIDDEGNGEKGFPIAAVVAAVFVIGIIYFILSKNNEDNNE